MKQKYSIGVDFGTLSGRAVLVDLTNGCEVATAVKDYDFAVMDEYLPDGITKLPPDWALQHPQDYLDVLKFTIPSVLQQASVSPEQVIGLGIDFTACTVLPIDDKGEPLCFSLNDEPHAYVKLWKHHAAQKQANKLSEIAAQRKEAFLNLYGGKISSEWMLPKIMQVAEEAPEIYNQADRFLEAGDWVILKLTGNECRNSCMAGYKAVWNKVAGYPSKEFLKELNPKIENVVEDKLSTDIRPIGSKAGGLNKWAAEWTGLCEGTAVAVANVDAHVAVPAVGITGPGKMLMIMGTSTCHLVLGEVEKIVPGMCGVVEDGILAGYQGFEAGQSCVGDHFNWFVDNCLPAHYKEEAAGKDLHQFLTEKAELLNPGESGLLALDWWNGNRSVLVDVDLTGLLIGCTLLTKPEEIYRALVEATAFGTRVIIEAFEKSGVTIDELYAAGGIAEKNSFMMQIYSDVTNKEIKISGSPQAPALGSAMFGAVAAGEDAGGFRDIVEAAKVMSRLKDVCYKPIKENVEIYEKLYSEYVKLHDYFGRGGNNVMKNLKELKKNQTRGI